MILRIIFAMSVFAMLTLTLSVISFSQDRLTDRPRDFVELSERLSPAVVNISTAQTIEITANRAFPKGSPLEKFNDFFGDGGDQNRIARSLGSGFVIDKDGYIVTNNHVIEGADEIEVAFPNGDTYEAQLVGRDPSTDIALLKIEAGKDIPFVDFAGQDSAKVGEWVLAIGNPLGYSSSVAVGVVSARHRQISMTNYDDFIQTDVAINKGNSGGPLFNMDGDVVGVNTAIVSPTGFSVGLSFSIPADLASYVVDQLREYGETRRGFLGVRVQPVTKAIAKSYKLKDPHGALVRSVTKDGPAAKAGLKRGDLITTLGGVKLENSGKLARIIAEAEIDANLTVEYIRRKKRKTVEVLIERLEEKVEKLGRKKTSSDQDIATGSVMGIIVEDLSEKIRSRMGLGEDGTGVRVTKIGRNSIAQGKLNKGDIIMEVAQEQVEDTDDFIAKMKTAKENEEAILLLIHRNSGPVFYSLEPDA